MNNEHNKFPWSEWKVCQLIGSGTYGKVYKAVRQDKYTGDEFAAIKIISVPRTNVKEVIDEINIMRDLSNTPNILNILDCNVVEAEDEEGKEICNIFIRTKLLTPFKEYYKEFDFSEKDTIKLGIELCSALEYCHSRNIIHRDIKPSNILVDKENSIFVLCDFGIAKKIENTNIGLSLKGSYPYVAPEVLTRKTYDDKADIYSLGLVLYWCLNKGKIPFLDTSSSEDSIKGEEAVKRRINGESLPSPCNASDALSHIILKACAYEPENRFQSIKEMKLALIQLQNIISTANQTKQFYDHKGIIRLSDSRTTIPANEARNIECEPFEEEKDYKSKVPFIISVILIIILLLIVLVIYKIPKNKKNDKSNISVNEIVAEEETEIVTEEVMIDNTEEIEKAITAIINDSDALQEANNYDEALNKIQEGLELYPDSEKLKKEKEDISSKISIIHENEAALKAAKEMADNNDLVSALHLLDDTLEKSESNGISDANLTEKAIEYNVAYTNQVAEQVKEYTNNNNYDAAIETLSNALAEFPDYIVFSTKLDEVKNAKATFELNQKKEQILKEAEELYNSQEYEQAIKKLQSVTELSSDSDIQAKIVEYKEHLPISLISLTSTNEKNTSINNGVKDSRDNSYNNVISFTSDDWIEGGYIEYYTGRKYSKLSFMFVTDKDYNRNKTARIEVYADDKCLYSYNEITYKTEPFLVQVDISDAQYLRIECSKESGGYYGLGGEIYVIAPYVQK